MGKNRDTSNTIIRSTDNPNVSIHISYPAHKEEEIKIQGYPVNENGHRLTNGRTRTIVAKNQSEISIKIEQLKERIITDLKPPEKYIPPKILKSGELDNDSEWVKTFHDFMNNKMAPSEWSDGAAKTRCNNFARYCLPAIQHCMKDEDFTYEDKNKMTDKYIERALAHGNSHHMHQKAEKIAADHMKNNKAIADVLIAMSYGALPTLSNLMGADIAPIKSEQLKILPIQIHKDFRKIVEANVKSNPIFARAAALMDAGLRSGEAAATISEQVLDLEKFIVVIVEYTEKEGKRNFANTREATLRKRKMFPPESRL